MKKFLIYLLPLMLLASCSSDDAPDNETPVIDPVLTGEDLIVCNEGNWQSDNGQLSYYNSATGVLTNQWFRSINGMKLGDTPKACSSSTRTGMATRTLPSISSPTTESGFIA